VSDDIVRRDAISLDGDKVGEISDVLMEPEGELIGFQLARGLQIGYALDTVLAECPRPEANWIPAEAMHSMGQDVLVIGREGMKAKS
jgi:uncharacterized protein YrrD